jgi:hypothetical protein
VTKKPHPESDINNLEMSHRCDSERHRFSQEHKERSDLEVGASGFGLGISALVLLPLEAALFISPCSEPFAGLTESIGAIFLASRYHLALGKRLTSDQM